MQQISEDDMVQRWASGELVGALLYTTSGERLSVLYPGRPGGGAGPDFLDAVIRLGDEQTLCGDVEVHVRGGAWRTHGHDDDPRYRNVILHVVLTRDLQPTIRLDRAIVPVLALADVVKPPTLPLRPAEGEHWPCQQETTRLKGPELQALLDQSGQARFLEKAAAFEPELLPAPDQADRVDQTDEIDQPGWNMENRTLFVGLAEGLAYKREREAFRGLGEQLAAIATRITSPAGVYEALLPRLEHATRLDRQRLAALIVLAVRWRERGPWPELWALLSRPDPDDAREALLRALTISSEVYQVPARHRADLDKSLSAGRAAILIWNVVLPFAYTWARAHGDATLAERALSLALEFPGLPPNQITRAMQAQLFLPKHPKLALAQQGLQHVYQHWCKEKLCAACPCAKAGNS